MKVLVFFSALLAITMASNVFRSNYINLNENNTKLGITDGKNATRNQFPYMASIQELLDDGIHYDHFCGGSIISRNWILTAYHCTYGSPVNKRVVTGVLLLSEAYTTPIGPQIRNISKIIQHPLHPDLEVQSPYDIALILLDHPLQFTASIQPIALPNAGLISRGFGFVSGWGLTVWGGYNSDPLQWTYVPIIPESECKAILDDILVPQFEINEFDENFNLCSGNDIAYEQPCNGDSGSPYVMNGKIIGIVSWGLGHCGTRKQPSVYVKVSSFIDWITENTNGEVRPS